MNIFMNSRNECESVRERAQSSGAPSGVARPGVAVELAGAVGVPGLTP